MLSHAEMVFSHLFAIEVREYSLTEEQKDYIRNKWENNGFYLDDLDKVISEAKREVKNRVSGR